MAVVGSTVEPTLQNGVLEVIRPPAPSLISLKRIYSHKIMHYARHGRAAELQGMPIVEAEAAVSTLQNLQFIL